MKKVLVLLAVFAAYSVVLFSAEVKKMYIKIRSAEELVEGNYLIVAQAYNKWYALGFQDSYNREAVQVEVVDDKITTEVATSSSVKDLPYALTLESLSNGWRLNDPLGGSEGKYLMYDESSSKNDNLKLTTSSSVRWNITVEADGVVRLVFKNKYYLACKTGANFGSSTNGNSHQVYLFKETSSVEDPDPIVIPAPAFSPAGGTYDTLQSVTISAEGNGLTIYYTLDNNAAEGDFAPYTAPVEVSASVTLRAYAQDGEGNRSAVVSSTYTIVEPDPEEPVDPDPDPETPDITDLSIPAVWTQVFRESFDKNAGEGGNDGKWDYFTWRNLVDEDKGGDATYLPSANLDKDGWEIEQGAVMAGNGCLIFKGRRTEENYLEGELISPSLGFEGNALLRFKVGIWNTQAEQTGFTLKSSSNSGSTRFLVNGESLAVYEVPDVSKGEFTTVEVLLTGVKPDTRICFCTPEERSNDGSTTRTFLDEVEVYSIRSAGEGAELEENSFLSGTWTPAQLAELAGTSAADLSAPVMELDLEAMDVQLSEHFAVDNSEGTPNLVVHSPTAVTLEDGGLNAVAGAMAGESLLADLENFSLSREVEGGAVAYLRAFSGVGAEEPDGWSVLCLPFAVEKVANAAGDEYIPYAEWIKSQPANVGFFWLKQATADADAINTDASSIEPNVPYLIAFPNYGYEDYPLLSVGAGEEFTFSGQGLKATTALAPGTMPAWQFHANYLDAGAAKTEATCYVLDDKGSGFDLDPSARQPFRPYVTFEDCAAQSAPLRFAIGKPDVPSALMPVAFPGKAVSPLRVEDTSAGLLLTADARVQVRVYTLYGVLVKALPMQAGETVQIDLAPGVYIVNQQKVVVYGK